MNNILNLKHCYGCGVCSIICPQNIITLSLDVEGFYLPTIKNLDRCTNCGRCLSVCAYDNELLDSTSEIKSYAGWSNDKQVRKNCSSGGIGFELGCQLIKQSYKACGVKYNPELNRAEHFIASTIEEFIPSIGSKYIQSYTVAGFSQFNRKDKFFVSGTPCQIDSLRRYIRKMKIEENFVLMDFFCHGIPSINMWKKYTEMVEKKIGKITYASWRNKRTNWHDNYGMLIRGEKGLEYFSLMSKGDLFYKFFLGNMCLGKACYDKCKYKYDKSAADIRIGDLLNKKYKKGISAMLVFTDKGDNIISHLLDCTLKKEDISAITEGQMKFSPPKTYMRNYLLKAFSTNFTITYIYKSYQYFLFPTRVINKLLKMVHVK